MHFEGSFVGSKGTERPLFKQLVEDSWTEGIGVQDTGCCYGPLRFVEASDIGRFIRQLSYASPVKSRLWPALHPHRCGFRHPLLSCAAIGSKSARWSRFYPRSPCPHRMLLKVHSRARSSGCRKVPKSRSVVDSPTAMEVGWNAAHYRWLHVPRVRDIFCSHHGCMTSLQAYGHTSKLECSHRGISVALAEAWHMRSQCPGQTIFRASNYKFVPLFGATIA